MSKVPNVHSAEPIPDAARAAVDRLMQTGDLFRYTADADAPVALLEGEFAEMLGSTYALAVSSCSAALFLSLKALDSVARLLTSISAPEAREVVLLESNIDDMPAEHFALALERCFDAGALDAWLTPIQMKKQRPGILLTVLAKPEDKDTFLDLIFRETTTFGVREHLASRTVLERRSVEVNTQYGAVRVKVGRWQGKDVTSSPEHDDCVKLAKESDVAVREIYEAAIRNI